MAIVNMLKPDVLEEFSCVGSACRNNCCNQPWTILVDKKTYKKYRNIREPKWLAGEIKDYVKRKNDAKYDGEYASLRQLSNPTRCAFQTEDGLCKIQKELGEGYLCDVCRRYPRILSRFYQEDSEENYLEETCSVSCEEVVRLLFEKKSHIQFITSKETEEFSPFKKYSVAGVLNENVRPILKHYYEIKMISIAILQNDDYAFEDRLVLLNLFFYKLEELEKEEQQERVPTLIAEFTTAVNEFAYNEILHMEYNEEVSNNLAYSMIKQSLWSVYDYNEVLSQIEENLNEEGASFHEYVINYQAFMTDKWHLMENIFVNELFKCMMPFHGNFSIFENSIYLSSLYAVLRFLMAGKLGKEKEMNEIEMIDLIAYFGRLIIHNEKKIENIVALTKKNQMNTPAYMAVLIKG